MQKLCCKAYLAIRKNRQLLMTLFRLMLSTGIPELAREKDCANLRQPLRCDGANSSLL